ncbi:MAG: pyrroline-5-carboxylate reductase [Alphaproteobacteria bacterium]
MTDASLESARILLVGCGKMGGALLRGWLDRGLRPAHACVVEPARDALAWAVQAGVRCVDDRAAIPVAFRPDIVVFAVKPQAMATVAPAYADIVAGGAGALSIAAGTRIATFEGYFGADAPVLRAMPNTPAAIGHGMSVLVANAAVDGPRRALAEALMAAVGQVAWVDDEGLMDAVTAVSGSGPAYVFLLIETLAAAGEAVGLAPALAAQLARVTVAGAGALAERAVEPADQLRRNVTSPGGTTAAALGVLMRDGDGMAALLREAVEAATRRGRELGG